MTAVHRPRFIAGVRLHFDAVRDRHVLLYPEGALALNETAAAALALVDGRRTTANIIESLRGRYLSVEIASDVDELLTTIRDQGLLRDVDA
jgi:pyrroloquinoline quinone biosynthesis protein D